MKIEQLNMLLELLNEFHDETNGLDCHKVQNTIYLVKDMIDEKEDEKKYDDDANVLGLLQDNFKFRSIINPLAKDIIFTAQKDGKSFIVRWNDSGKERYTERDLYDAINMGDYVIID